MAIVLAIAAALVYGAADFFGGLASRRSAAVAVAVWSQVAGLLLLVLVVPLLPSRVDTASLAWGAVAGFGGAAGVGLLYRGLALGAMGVVSPITAALAAVVPVLFALARGERPPHLALIGVATVIAAIVLVSASPSPPGSGQPRGNRRFPPGVPEAIGGGLAFGALFVALAQSRPEAGLLPLLSMRLTSIAVLVLAAVALPKPQLRLEHTTRGLVAAAGLLDMSSNVLYLLASRRGSLAIVAVVTSLYPAATVVLAAAVLRERLTRPQWSGMALALIGIVLLAAAR